MSDRTHPRVFISYAWEGPAHRDWVRFLAEQLKHSGIEARLDQWHLRPGESLTHFMEVELDEADRCIVVCTPRYAEKSRARTGGVGYEQQIISTQVLSGRHHGKFIPVLRAGECDRDVPGPLMGLAAVDMRSDEGFTEALEALVRVILDRPRYVPPPLGTPPDLQAEPHSRPVLGPSASSVLQVPVINWYELDLDRFVPAVFDVLTDGEIPPDLRLRIDSPDYVRLVAFIRSQSEKAPAKIRIAQLAALDSARARMARVEAVGMELLAGTFRLYGAQSAFDAFAQFIRMALAYIAFELGHAQLDEPSVALEGFSGWFSPDHLYPSLVQFAYGRGGLLEVIVAAHEYASGDDEYAKVFLPAEKLENDGTGDLISGIFESAIYIPRALWTHWVLPQMAAWRVTGYSQYLPWSAADALYSSPDGIIWQGEKQIFPEEQIKGTRSWVIRRHDHELAAEDDEDEFD